MINMSFIQTPSLAAATGTRVDSACKHIQQCRVSYDHMLDFVENSHELERNKMQYCVHKDEMVVGIARPWAKDTTKGLPASAYPRIISNLGDITTKNKYQWHLKMIKYMYHFATSLQKRNEIINQMKETPTHSIPSSTTLPQDHQYFVDDTGRAVKLKDHLSKMYDFYSVGVSNTMGYAHPNSGDTMSSIMIGGLRTIMNGDFEVFAGDKIQWYWTFERNCFRRDGSRKSITDANNIVQNGGNPEVDYKGRADPPRPDEPRRIRNDYQFGVTDSGSPADKAKHVARIKPYIPDDEQPRLYDYIRVFAVAISSARPNEMVDIKICRQSM